MGKRYREMLRDVAAMPPGLAPALRIEGPDGTATADDAVPTAFTWRDQRYRVRAVLGRWREDRAWTIDPSATDWLGEGATTPTTPATPATRATPAPAVTSATTAATAPTTMATETSATTAATTVTRSATTAATTATRSATTTATPAATTPAATPTGSTPTTAATATTPAASTPTATTPAATTPAAATRTAPGAAVGRLVLGAASDVREHWRVEAIGPRGVGVYELCRRGEQWRLERVWD